MVTPAAKREAVVHLRSAFEVSERRACSVLEADRTSIRYRSTRPDDAAMRTRLRELASQRRRFGYRRLHILLAREGLVMNHKKLRRLYREERLQVRRRSGRLSAPGRRSHCRRASISVGASTSRRMRSATAAAFAFSRSLTTSHASAWHWSPILPCPDCGWYANSMRSSPFAAGRPRASLTTAPS